MCVHGEEGCMQGLEGREEKGEQKSETVIKKQPHTPFSIAIYNAGLLFQKKDKLQATNHTKSTFYKFQVIF